MQEWDRSTLFPSIQWCISPKRTITKFGRTIPRTVRIRRCLWLSSSAADLPGCSTVATYKNVPPWHFFRLLASKLLLRKKHWPRRVVRSLATYHGSQSLGILRRQTILRRREVLISWRQRGVFCNPNETTTSKEVMLKEPAQRVL